MVIKNEMVDAICKEISLQKDYLGEEIIESIYFGGGTPSLLNDEQLNKILLSIQKHFSLHADIEITIEANPDDITAKRLDEFYTLGINRLSVGIQSFEDKILKWMNRAHDAKNAEDCLRLIHQSNFQNYSLDLIYGIPIANKALWVKDLEKLIQYNPPHISSYCLTIEPNTVFGTWQKKGQLKETSEDEAAEQFIHLMERLQVAGYQQYEISNFCKPGMESKHNSAYWQQKPYLGIGPSAHSYDGKNRQFNVVHNMKYLNSLKADVIPFELDKLNRNDHINEYIMTSLRTSEGCSLDFLRSKYSFDLLKEYSEVIAQWQANGLCNIQMQKIQLTQKGKLLADQLASDLFLT